MSSVNWLLLDLNSYFASCEQQDNPSLRNKPVAVVPMVADTTVCIAASYEAKAFGVKTGTQVREAKRLCPQIHLIEARHELYVRYHHQIVDVVESCLPVTSVLSIDEMACELKGSHQDLKRALQLATLVKSKVRSVVGDCLKSSVGLAPNQFLAKVASDMQKPDGLTVILKEELPQKLFALKLRDLPGIGPKMEARLNQRAIYSIQKLASLSSAEMRQLWGGIVGERVWGWLRGEEIDRPETKNQSVSHSHVLDPASRNAAGALLTLKKLTTKLAVRLRHSKQWAQGMAVEVSFVGDQNKKWLKRCSVVETQNTLTFLDTLDYIWKDFREEAAPLKVGVVFYGLISEEAHTPSLFENPNRERLSTLMDSINQKYGKNTLYLGAVHELEKTAPTRIAFQRIPELQELED